MVKWHEWIEWIRRARFVGVSEPDSWDREEDAFYALHGHESDVPCVLDDYCFVRENRRVIVSDIARRAEAIGRERAKFDSAEVVRVKGDVL